MADLSPVIETMEHRWMRAWVERDSKALKSLTSRKFIMLTGSKPPVILDNRSWIEAATTRYLCRSYRFGDVYVRDLGQIALFATQLELEATMDGRDWSRRVWIADLWQKSWGRKRWRMIERIVSKTEGDAQVPAAMRSLQLWRNRPAAPL
jgi:hypothetical protein